MHSPTTQAEPQTKAAYPSELAEIGRLTQASNAQRDLYRRGYRPQNLATIGITSMAEAVAFCDRLRATAERLVVTLPYRPGGRGLDAYEAALDQMAPRVGAASS